MYNVYVPEAYQKVHITNAINYAEK